MSSPSPNHLSGETALGRAAFHGVWFFLAPLLCAFVGVLALTPGPDTFRPDPIRSFVGDQQIPAGIILFTLATMVFWRLRHHLPLARQGGVLIRADLTPAATAKFEEANALHEELRRIERTHHRALKKKLSSDVHAQISGARLRLEGAMRATSFDQAELESAHAALDALMRKHLEPWRKGEMRDYIESIGFAIVVALLLRAGVVEAFKIPSGSMIPTLSIGDHIFVNKFIYGPVVPGTDTRLLNQLPPERGDVLVFKFPENTSQDFIKRAIALPGDTLEVIGGRPLINGWLLPNCDVGPYEIEGQRHEAFVEYLHDRAYLTLLNRPPTQTGCRSTSECGISESCRAGLCGDLDGPFQVPDGQFYVLGDNRSNSHDSRSWRGGAGGGVPFSFVKGRAMFVWASFSPSSRTFGESANIFFDRFGVSFMGAPALDLAHHELSAGLERCLKSRPSLEASTPPSPKRSP